MEILETELLPGDPPVLRVAGEIDLSTAGQMRAALESALSSDPRAVVDMAGVTFFDASGLRVLLEVAKSRNGAGPLPLLGASRVAKVLEIVGLRDLPTIVFGDGGDERGR